MNDYLINFVTISVFRSISLVAVEVMPAGVRKSLNIDRRCLLPHRVKSYVTP
jgi:hypothetical protein